VPVPWRLVRTPRVSRHLAAAPQENTIYTATHIRLLSDPPRQTQTPFSRCMRHLRVETRSCMVCKGQDQGRVEGGKCNKVYSTYRRLLHLPRSTRLHTSVVFPIPSTNTNTLQPLYATPACRSKVLHGVQRAGSGEGQGGEMQQSVQYVS
jgi:hypothetical protein